MTFPPVATSLSPRLRWAWGLLLVLAAWLGPAAAARGSRFALVNLGPNDRDYTRGFRPDWERDGLTPFRRATSSASLVLPVAVRGDGVKLRIRPHSSEATSLRLTLQGEGADPVEIRFEPDAPSRTLEVGLPHLAGQDRFALDIQALALGGSSPDTAFEWVELESASSRSEFVLVPGMRGRIILLAFLAVIAPCLAGAKWEGAVLHGFALVVGLSLGARADIVAVERILREGLPVYGFVALVSAGLARSARVRSALGIGGPRLAGGLVLIVLVGVAVRLVLVLHPQFYYPDATIHGAFASVLAEGGPAIFLRDFMANQFRHSLGLQLVNGHWYALPYPPLFYVLCWPLLRLARYQPETAVAVLAAAVNSLEAFLVFGFGRRLTGSALVALASAAAVPLLPIFLARLTLAYFPDLVGHALDAGVLLYLFAHLHDLDRRPVVFAASGLLALAFLTYTQSLLNFGIILPLFLALQMAFDRSPHAWRRNAGLALVGILGACLAFGVFYARYVSVFLDMHRGAAMSEERILLQRMEWRRHFAGATETSATASKDPYSGRDVDLVRGLKKAMWRLWIFYGVFAPAVLAGSLLVFRRLPGTEARLAAAWGLTYLLLNLGSAGLPGPNLLRYNKDLEIVAPLFCVALGSLGVWLWERGRASSVVALAGAAGFLVFGAGRAAGYLTERFVLQR